MGVQIPQIPKRNRVFAWLSCFTLLCTLTAWIGLDSAGSPGPSWLGHPYAAWDLDLREPEPDSGQSCLLPRVHPFDPSVLEYLSPPKPVQCKVRQHPLTLIDQSGRLCFNVTALKESGYSASRLGCTYRELFRPQGDDFGVGYGPWRPLTEEGVLLQHDFVSVACYNFLGLTVYDFLHAHVSEHGKKQLLFEKTPNKSVVKKRRIGMRRVYREEIRRKRVVVDDANHHASAFRNKDSSKITPESAFSVFIFGVDSLSRLSFIRQLPRTYRYLTENMQSFVFRGMTKVGDNTFPNLAALLTGKSLEELSYSGESKSYDDWPCLWKEFASHGYATMFAEDQPHIGLFNYLREGLRSQPTDHYLRPYWLAVEGSKLHRLSSNLCYGGVPKHLLQLKYAKDFVRSYKDSASFGFSFLVELSHDYVSRVTVADRDFESWLQEVHGSGLLNRTVLLFMSDHGHRFDAVRATLVGRIEERMPFFALYIPPELLKTQPHVSAILKSNTGRLTSLYDAHATFRDILKLSVIPNHALGTVTTGKGVSLLGHVSLNRTCQNAGVPDHYCVCEEESPLVKDDYRSVAAAKAVMTWLNKILESFNASTLCVKLKLHSIEHANLVGSSRRVQVNSRVTFGHQVEDRRAKGMMFKLRVQINVRPSGGVFEATVEHRADEDLYTVADVSRINRYGEQSWCIQDPVLRKYCFCREQKS